MSFFKKLFGKAEPQSSAPSAKANDQKTAITLLFSKLPRFESPQSVQWSQGNLLPLEIQVVTEGFESMAYATLGPHRLLLVGFSAPLPKQVQQQTIHLSNWPDQAKQIMYSHQAHLICFYESGSDDPNEQRLEAVNGCELSFADQNQRQQNAAHPADDKSRRRNHAQLAL